ATCPLSDVFCFIVRSISCFFRQSFLGRKFCCKLFFIFLILFCLPWLIVLQLDCPQNLGFWKNLSSNVLFVTTPFSRRIYPISFPNAFICFVEHVLKSISHYRFFEAKRGTFPVWLMAAKQRRIYTK